MGSVEVDDVAFYVEQARASGGPVVELGVGTGRVAVPIARAGVRVIGIDMSAEMLERCRLQAEQAGVTDLIDLRLRDFRSPPVTNRSFVLGSSDLSSLDDASWQPWRAHGVPA